MEENKVSKKSWGVVPFLIGFIVALVGGWVGTPKLLYSTKTQPINFDHPLHVEQQGLQCDQCHVYRADGSYAGLPTLAKCMECHTDVMQPDNPNDVKFVEEYVKKEQEIPWLVYQKQPDNAYFSHIAHQSFECTQCHPDVAKQAKLPAYQENRLSGYSKQTMKMWQCERCHAENGASNACYVCHK